MPSINLRLTEQQHAELLAWAQDGHRSVQKEIIYRLFTIEGNQAQKVEPATSGPRTGIEVPLGQTAALEADRHFKPDPKPVRK